MNNVHKEKALNICIFISFITMLVYLTTQIYADNYKYTSINIFSLYRCVIAVLFFICINMFIYLQFNNINIFRLCLITQYTIMYLFGLFTLNHFGILYFPIIILIFITFFSARKTFILYLAVYLICSFSFLIYTLINTIYQTSLLEVITYEYLAHILASLIIVLVITAIFFSERNTPLNLNFRCNKTKKPVITTTDNYSNLSDIANKQSPELTITKSINIPSERPDFITLTNKLLETSRPSLKSTPISSDICNRLNTDITVAQTNSKSVYKLSSIIKKDIESIRTISNDLDKSISLIKANIISNNEHFNAIKRINFNLNSSSKNIESDLHEAYKHTDLLKDLLFELENLSDITTHLANQTIIEKTYKPYNATVMDYIIKEFNSYADQIRRSVLNMSTIFERLNKSYYSCNKEFKHFTKLIASQNQIINDLYTSLDMANGNLNSMLKNTSRLDSTLSLSTTTSKRLVADSSELHNAVGQFAKLSYSISKLRQ